MSNVVPHTSRSVRTGNVDPRILLLALASFALSTDALIMIGMMPTIAHEMQITEGVAGQLITAFSLTYALTGPVLSALTSSLPRNRVLIVALFAFCLANLGAALSPTIAFLFAMRMVSGASAALYGPLASAIGVSLAPPEKRGQALSLIVGGSTVALVLGGPLGTWVGEHFGWRMSFGLVAAVSGIACLVLWFIHLPKTAVTTSPPGSARVAPMRDPRLLLALSPAFLWIIGFYVVYTYLAPLLEQNMHVTDVSSFLMVFGLGTVAGNWLGGRLADRFGATRPIIGNLVGLTLILSLFSLMTTRLFGALPVLFLLGMAMPGLSVSQQHRILKLAPSHTQVILALNVSIMYLGGAVGAALGGTLLHYIPLAWLGALGAGCTLIALLVFFLSIRVSKPIEDAPKQSEEG